MLLVEAAFGKNNFNRRRVRRERSVLDVAYVLRE